MWDPENSWLKCPESNKNEQEQENLGLQDGYVQG